MNLIQELLPRRMEQFPIKYIGLPLAVKKLTKAQLQPLIDKVADLLLGWKAELLTKAGRVVHVQFVITATIVYHAMALDLPPWAIKAIDKIRRNYLWRGRKETRGGHCMIAWSKVTRPKELGDLSISNLQGLNWHSECVGSGLRRPSQGSHGSPSSCNLVRWCKTLLTWPWQPNSEMEAAPCSGRTDGCWANV
jgi:hypothetical protein